MAKFSTVSIFSSNVFLGVTNSNQILAIFLGIMQWWKRNEILNFLNSIIVVHIDSKSKLKLEKMIVRSCTSIMIYFIVIYIINANLFKVSLLGVLGLYVLTYTILVIVCYASFLKNFETLFIIMLESFEKTLKIFLKKPSFDTVEYQRLLKYYQNILKLNDDFNKLFAPQNTMFIFLAAFSLVCLVRNVIIQYCYNHKRIIK